MTNRKIIVGACAVSLLVVIGCGDDDDDKPAKDAGADASDDASSRTDSGEEAGKGGKGGKGGQGGFVEDIAHNYRIPLVNLIDGSGGSVTSAGRRGYSVLPGIHGFEQSVKLLGEVPVVSGVMGTAAGGPAGRAILSQRTVL